MSIFDDTRADWGAAPRKSGRTVAATSRQQFFVHWNGPKMSLTASDPHSKCLQQVRAFQRYHMSKGWSDIGYNGLTCPHGRNIEGRGIDYVGAHCTNFNTSGYGWQAMVGEGNVIPDAMYNGILRAYEGCNKRSKKTLAKRGHRDGMSTTCPGRTLYAWVKAGMPKKGSISPKPSKPTTTPKPPAPVAKATSLTKTLRKGDSGAQVTLLQTMLNKTRNAKLDVDGKFGPKTEKAVIAAHKAWNVAQPHNVVGPGFRKKINAEYNKKAPSKKTRPKLRRGDRGEAVKELQRLLGRLEVDGSFGPATNARVLQFQRANKLDVDGVVGPKTWEALLK